MIPTLVDAYVNLGRLAHEAGDAREAARLDHLALERSPDDPIVHFNLALALEDLGAHERPPSRTTSARSRSIPTSPTRTSTWPALCEQLGREAEAVRHYHAYKKLTEG